MPNSAAKARFPSKRKGAGDGDRQSPLFGDFSKNRRSASAGAAAHARRDKDISAPVSISRCDRDLLRQLLARLVG